MRAGAYFASCDRPQIVDFEFYRGGSVAAQHERLAHGYIGQRGNDAPMQYAGEIQQLFSYPALNRYAVRVLVQDSDSQIMVEVGGGQELMVAGRTRCPAR